MKGQSTAISYDTATDLGTGESGFYYDKTDVKFDDFKVYQAVVRDAHTLQLLQSLIIRKELRVTNYELRITNHELRIRIGKGTTFH